MVGAWRAFRSSAPQSHLKNAPLRPRRRPAPHSARSLAPSTPIRLHARVTQAAKPPLRFAPGRAVYAPSASAFQGTRSHFRLAQNAVAVAPSPRPGKPRPTRVPPVLQRLTLFACFRLPSSPPGAFSKPLRGVASPGALAAPGVLRLVPRRSKFKVCKLKASYKQVESFLSHSPRSRPGERALLQVFVFVAYPG